MADDGKVVYKIEGDNTGFSKDLGESESLASKSWGKIKSAGTAAFAAVGAAVAAAGAGIVAAAKAGMEYNATIEQYSTSFEVMTGSAEKAVEVVEKLKELGAATPFEMEDLAQATQLLMNYGFEADDAIDKMTMLGDISQGSAEKMTRIATAYGQMSSAGKVSLEDVKQMIEAGFNPLQEITESTGESMASLYDRISKGTLAVDEITAAMVRSTSAGGKYFQSMEKQSKTFNGLMSTLKDNAKSLLGQLTSGLSDIATSNALPKIIGYVEDLSDAFEKGGWDGFTKTLGTVMSDAIGEISSALPEFIGAASDIVSGLVQGLKENAPEIAQGAVEAAAALVEGFLDIAPELLSAGIKLAGELVSGIGQALPELIPEVIDSAIDAVVGLISDLPSLLAAGAELVAGLVKGILNGIPALFEGLITGIGEAVGLIDPEIAAYSERLDSIKEANDAVAENMRQTSEKFNGNLDEIDAKMILAQGWVGRLQELEKQTSLTAQEQQEWETILFKLSETFPELSGIIDLNTLSIMGGTDALLQYVQNWKNVALAKAYMERAEEDINGLIDATERLNDATAAQEEISGQVSAREQEILGIMQQVADQYGITAEAGDDLYESAANLISVMEASAGSDVGFTLLYDQLIGVNSEYAMLNGQLDEANTELQEAQQHYDNLNASIDENMLISQQYTAQAEQQSEALKGFNQEVQNEAEANAAAAEQWGQSMSDAGAQTEEAFGQTEEAVGAAVDGMNTSFADSELAVQNWTNNLASLAQSGLDEGFIAVLENAGYDAATAVQGMVNLTQEQISQLNAVFQTGSWDAVNAMLTEFGLPEVQMAGSDVVDTVATGMDQNTALEDTAKETASDTFAALENEVKALGFDKIGQQIMQGLQIGLESKRSALMSTASSIASSIRTTIQSALDIHSPSRVGIEIGEMFDLGIEKGLVGGMKGIREAVDGIGFGMANVGTGLSSVNNNISLASHSNIVLTVDGMTLAQVMLQNLDDAAAYTLRG